MAGPLFLLIKVISDDVEQTKISYKVLLICLKMTFKTVFMKKNINKYLDFSEKKFNHKNR
jgi:hypothetical protein